ARHGDPLGPLCQRQQRRGTRGQVPLRSCRVHYGPPVLQGRGEHRDARGPPVGGGRHPARHCHLQQRDGQRLAAGQLLQPCHHQRQHHLHRLLLCARRTLRLRLLLLRLGGGQQLSAASPGQRGGWQQRSLSLHGCQRLPHLVVQLDQLLGRRPVHHGSAGHHPPHGG